jgi:hypothetical protein
VQFSIEAVQSSSSQQLAHIAVATNISQHSTSSWFRSEGYEMRIDVVTISTQVNRIFTSVAGQLDPQPSNAVKRSETSQHVWSF